MAEVNGHMLRFVDRAFESNVLKNDQGLRAEGSSEGTPSFGLELDCSQALDLPAAK